MTWLGFQYSIEIIETKKLIGAILFDDAFNILLKSSQWDSWTKAYVVLTNHAFNILLKSSAVLVYIIAILLIISFNILLKSSAGLVFVLGFKVFPSRSSGFVGTCFCS